MNLPPIDHVVLDVGDDLDGLAATYRGLGFQLTERGHHTLGSSNHLAMFASNYLELLSPGKPGSAMRQDLVGFPRGLNGLVFATDDADARYRDLTVRGIAVREPNSFSRPVALADGTTRDAKFRTTHLTPGAAPFGRLYFCQHDTRDLVWRPEWQRHANGTRDIVGLTIAAADPAATGALLTRMFDAVPTAIADGGLRFMAGAAAIDIMPAASLVARLGAAAPDPAGRGDYVALILLGTASIAAARTLPGARVLPGNGAGSVLIPASAAGNVALEFRE